MKPSVVVFDIDGMLNHGRRFSDRLSEEFDVPMELIDPFFKHRFNDCLIGNSYLEKELAPFLDIWGWKGDARNLIQYWLQDDRLDEQMLGLATRLREHVPCVVATNQEYNRTHHLIDALDLNKRFDKVYSSVFMACKKPERAFFERIEQDYGNPAEIVFWDDDLENIAGAQKYGLRAYQFRSANGFVHTMYKECGIDLRDAHSVRK